MSGLSLAVLVVEAAEKSGTLITARLALEQGREVCAVPGSPLDPRSSGTNRLIRQGAVLARHADDVITALEGNVAAPRPDLFMFNDDTADAPLAESDLEAACQKLEELFSLTPTHRDVLLRTTDLSPAQFADVLLELCLSGVAEEVSGGMFALAATSTSRRST